MGWFGKDAKDEEPKTAPAEPKTAPEKKEPARAYTFNDFWKATPPAPELPTDASRIDVLTREVQALKKQVLDYRVRIDSLEASRLADSKSIDDWFRNHAKGTFCDLRDAHIKDLRREVVITDEVRRHIHQAVEDVAKDVFSTNEAHTFAVELGKAIIRACGRKLGQNW